MTFLNALIADALLLMMVAILGAKLAISVLGRSERWEIISLALPLGIGSWTFLIFILSWIGMPITLQTALVSYFGLISLLLGVELGFMNRDRVPSLGDYRNSEGSKIYILPAILLILTVSIFFAIRRSYSTWDAIAIWAAKGYGIALEGTIFAGVQWGAHRLSYPLNIPIMIALFKLASQDLLPGSKSLFPLFYASVLFGISCFWDQQRIRPALSFLGILMAGTVPMLFFHSTIGYVNLPMAAYLVLGTIWSWRGISEKSARQQLMGGILLGFASWTREEAMLYCLAIIAGLLIAAVILRYGKVYPIAWLSPFVMITGLWAIFFISFASDRSQATSAMSVAVAGFKSGDYNLGDLRLIFSYLRRYLFRRDTWGLLFSFATLATLVKWRRIVRDRDPTSIALLLTIVGTGFATILLFYIGSYISTGLYGWLQRGFPRAFFPSALLTMAFSIDLIGSSRDVLGPKRRDQGMAMGSRLVPESER